MGLFLNNIWTWAENDKYAGKSQAKNTNEANLFNCRANKLKFKHEFWGSKLNSILLYCRRSSIHFIALYCKRKIS